MRKFYLCVAGILLGSSACLAQKNYLPGFIIKSPGDTLKGFIEYKRWDRSPLKIFFKKLLEEKPTEYTPIQIKSFGVANENYESAIVDVDASPHKIAELSQTSTPEFIRDTVFLQILVQGEKTLLHLKDRNAKNHFYIKEEEKYQPLVYKQYIIMGGPSGKFMAKNESYKNLLDNYLKNCSSIQNRIKTAKYEVGPLTKLFYYYYQCTNQSINYRTERKEGKVELGIVAGASLSTLKFTGGISYIVDNDYESSINPTVGIFCDLKILRSNNWTVSNDIMYTSFNVKGEAVGGGNGFPEYTSRAAFNFHYMKTHHLLQMNLLKKHIFFLSAGFSTGFALKDDYSITIQYENQIPSNWPFASRKFETGYLVGLGFRKNRWNAEARYEFSSGMSDYLELEEQTTRIHLLVKYRLK